MKLRENSGGDKNLFSVERKLKRLKRIQEKKNEKIYEREKNKVDVFTFLNKKLEHSAAQNIGESKNKHRYEIKLETSRNLNVASLKIEEDVKKINQDIFKIQASLKRHSDVKTSVNKNLRAKLNQKQEELKLLKAKSLNIINEQSIRSDRKKLTTF